MAWAGVYAGWVGWSRMIFAPPVPSQVGMDGIERIVQLPLQPGGQGMVLGGHRGAPLGVEAGGLGVGHGVRDFLSAAAT